jgi:type II secretory pathway predicted ATPase ExeA
MYERYYGLRERPFSLLPNPDFLYFSRQHYIAYGLLEYGLMQQAGFVVITGDIGTGKTTLVRYLMGHLTPDVDVGFITNTHPEFGGLLPWVADAFGIENAGNTPVEQYRAFTRFLQQNARRGRRALLIVDEGQNLDAKGLEELRTLSNINGGQQLLQIMLIGQPELREILRRPQLEQCAQRVTVDYHLQPLTLEESRTYITHRLQIAGGGERKIFDDAALDFVHAYSRGVPRLINVICDAAMVYGFASEKPKIDAQLIEEVVRDRLKGGILPVASDERVAAQ